MPATVQSDLALIDPAAAAAVQELATKINFSGGLC